MIKTGRHITEFTETICVSDQAISRSEDQEPLSGQQLTDSSLHPGTPDHHTSSMDHDDHRKKIRACRIFACRIRWQGLSVYIHLQPDALLASFSHDRFDFHIII